MKKIYLKDLTYNKLKKLCLNNKDFINYYGQRVYDDNMYCQEETGTAMFGKNYYEYITIKDHYTSFYLILRNWRKFIENIDKDYLSEEALILYNYIINKKEVLDNMCCYSDRFNNLEYHLEKKCEELLELCEKELHEYEKYPSDEEVFDLIYNYEWYLEKEYYTDNERKKIYNDIFYTKVYS